MFFVGFEAKIIYAILRVYTLSIVGIYILFFLIPAPLLNRSFIIQISFLNKFGRKFIGAYENHFSFKGFQNG